jgi:hypothetical protein
MARPAWMEYVMEAHSALCLAAIQSSCAIFKSLVFYNIKAVGSQNGLRISKLWHNGKKRNIDGIFSEYISILIKYLRYWLFWRLELFIHTCFWILFIFRYIIYMYIFCSHVLPKNIALPARMGTSQRRTPLWASIIHLLMMCNALFHQNTKVKHCVLWAGRWWELRVLSFSDLSPFKLKVQYWHPKN